MSSSTLASASPRPGTAASGAKPFEAPPQSVFRRRLAKFRRLKRGYYSFLVLIGLYLISFLNPFLINNRALIVRHEGNLYFPTFKYYEARTFGQNILGEAKYRDLKEQLRRIGVSEVDLGDVQDTEAFACFWIRLSRLVDGLEGRVLDALINWFEQNWAFTRVVFGTNSQDERQVRLFEEKGFRRLYILNYPDRDVQHLIYG